MPVATRQSFLDLLGRSNLLTPGQLGILRNETPPDADAASISARLLQQKLLTRWQAAQLAAGRSQFFLGRYKILEMLGQGGMGAVFKAEQPALGRMVALKVMSRAILKDPHAVARFQREIRSAAALDHPHIVSAYDADCVGDTYFLVMEFVEGRDLKAWIKQFRKLPVDWSCECIRQAALGLQHAFERGMAHRDIKPANLLVIQPDASHPPLVKILDMGLARFVSEVGDDGELTKSGQIMGTPDYIAPEQARNTKDADIRADIFSLGCTLFELLAGRVPFTGANVVEKLMARVLHDAPPVRSLRPEVPESLERVVARMLARDPQERFQTPREVASALMPFTLATGEVSRAVKAPVLQEPQVDPNTFQMQVDPTLVKLLDGLANHIAETPPLSQRVRPERRCSTAGIVATVAGVLVVAGLSIVFGPGRGDPPRPVGRPVPKSAETSEQVGAIVSGRLHDPEREAAEHLLRLGARLKVLIDGEPRDLSSIHQLPRGALPVVLQIKSVEAAGNQSIKDEDLECLERCPKIEQVFLQGTPIGDAALKSLSGMTSLHDLFLENTRITDAGLGFLAGRNLGQLYLTNTRVSDRGLRHLQGMTGMAYLYLGGTDVTDEGLVCLKEMSSLMRLFLGGTQVSDRGLATVATFTNLRVLELRWTSVTDKGLFHLEALSLLTELDLIDTVVTPAGISKLRDALPNCRVNGIPPRREETR